MSWYFAEHGVVNHDDEFVSSDDPTIHTNTIEGFWSLLKRQWHGTHHSYSPRYANAYAAELCFKHNHRKDKQGVATAGLGSGIASTSVSMGDTSASACMVAASMSVSGP